MLTLTSPRLRLRAATAESVRAELAGAEALASYLGVRVVSWPTPLHDADSMNWTIRYIEEHPDATGWALWYADASDVPDPPALVGIVGCKGLPVQDGVAEIGYGMLEPFQRRGYASESVRLLLAWIFGHGEVREVVAHTLPELTPSIGVLEKTGFTFVGPGEEEGTIRYRLPRERWTL